jgi:hypothetical protein
MNLPDWRERDSMDRYLRVHLKRWAEREKAPQDGLARLLWSAAAQVQPAGLSRLDLFRRWLMADLGKDISTQVPESFLSQAKVFSLQLNLLSVY